MEFTPVELRFIHAAHRELRMPRLLTVPEFMEEHSCEQRDAEIIVGRQVEKRARQLGPLLAAFRKEAAKSPATALHTVDLDTQIAANQF